MNEVIQIICNVKSQMAEWLEQTNSDKKCTVMIWRTLSMFPSQMVYLKTVSPSNGQLYPCFPRKWCALKSFPPQMAHFIHVPLANGMP